jgi:tetratricopeptide (TPR) repeat protein
LVIGLAGALIALAIEECGSLAFREPGLPPILLTVWAALWALVRRQRRAPEPAPEDKRLSNLTLRLGGVAVGVGAVILGFFGVQDWRATRARYRADVQLSSGNYAPAIASADFAGENLLDPFRNTIARLLAIRARAGEFGGRLTDSKLPPTNEDLAFAQDALARLTTQLDNVAPRFLGSARLRAELSRDLAVAYRQRGESGQVREYLGDAVRALEQHQLDEPFRLEVVEWLWTAKRGAHSVERLEWLRCLLRGGGIDPRFGRMFHELLAQEDFVAVVNDLFNVAIEDLERPPDRWMDRLSPETFRVAALAKALTGELEEAAKLAGNAVTMYEKAGPRLFAAHAATLDEMVGYDFGANPIARTEDNLILLADAQTILSSPADPDQALPGVLGQTRLQLLLAAAREDEARQQLRHLHPTGGPLEGHMAEAYADMAARFADRPQHVNRALNWIQRAIRLSPDLPGSHAVSVRLLLYRAALDQDLTVVGRLHDQALAAARRFLDLVPDRQSGLEYLGTLQELYPASPMWAKLRRLYPELPVPPPGVPPVQSEPADDQQDDAATTTPSEKYED